MKRSFLGDMSRLYNLLGVDLVLYASTDSGEDEVLWRIPSAGHLQLTTLSVMGCVLVPTPTAFHVSNRRDRCMDVPVLQSPPFGGLDAFSTGARLLAKLTVDDAIIVTEAVAHWFAMRPSDTPTRRVYTPTTRADLVVTDSQGTILGVRALQQCQIPVPRGGD